MLTTAQIAIDKIITSGNYGTIFIARDINTHKQMKCVCKKVGYREGKRYVVQGEWREHKKHGIQFSVKKSRTIAPPGNILEALSQSDIWPSLTPSRLSDIRNYAAESKKTEGDILSSAAHLNRVFKEKSISFNLKRRWSDLQEHLPTLKVLVDSGVSVDDAFIISNQLDGHTRSTLRSSPYNVLLAPSSSLEVAENIHSRLGLTSEITQAIKPLYYRHMQTVKTKGSTGEALSTVARIIHKQCDIPMTSIMDSLIEDEVVISDKSYSVIHSIYSKEKYIAQKISSMLQLNDPHMDKAASEYIGDEFFTQEQKLAVRNAIQKPISIITGGPGTGKTTTIKEVISNIEKCGLKADIVTLSGKAADRASEASGREASTIHSYLGITPSSPRSQKRFSGRAIVIDEASMVDISLFYQLMESIDESCKIILVGDINQLESIEPGSILEDIKASIPSVVTQLTRVQRFSEDSNINNFANGVLDNNIIYQRTNGLYTYTSGNNSHQLNTNMKIIESYIKRNGNMDNLQVISPTWKGENGVTSLNALIQDMIPRSDENVIMLGSRKFYEGDKVIAKKEIASQNISNGQMLKISSINYDENSIKLAANDKHYSIKIDDLPCLSLAYCITGHSSQGSEFKNVLFSITPQSERFADKKMLYTIATRAKENLIITTPENCMEKILENAHLKRRTFLSEMISEHVKKQERRPNKRPERKSENLSMQ